MFGMISLPQNKVIATEIDFPSLSFADIDSNMFNIVAILKSILKSKMMAGSSNLPKYSASIKKNCSLGQGLLLLYQISHFYPEVQGMVCFMH